MCISGVLYAIKNGIEHIKKYNLWHRAQILNFNDIEQMCYIFLWHTWNFLWHMCYISKLLPLGVSFDNENEETYPNAFFLSNRVRLTTSDGNQR
jgi:hypothetical protein